MDLIDQLNGLQSYPTLPDLHKYAAQLQALTAAQQNRLLASLKNTLLAADLQRMLSGAMPSTMTAPIFVQPTAPSDPDHPGTDSTVDPGFVNGTAPEIKPPAA
ncbi:hypothetical protein P0D69_28040 [Paraburkholderia sediminicola]|uniref:hypothetical protein n=1 Tax=Paraburkholderia sediminicola TaxID=458836 RepID=UPI0038BC9BE3